MTAAYGSGWVATALLASVLGVAASASLAQPVIKGVVSHVEDGDTMTISVGRDEYKIRLADIDAPETCHRARDKSCSRPGQPFGLEAQRALAGMALGKTAVATCRGASFDRTVCYVEVGGRDMSRELAAVGLVWWEPRFGKSAAVRAAALYAQERRAGVHSAALNIEPWVWRKDCWSAGQCPGAVN